MKRFYFFIMAFVGLVVTSCEMFDAETKYYVKYEVEAVEGTDVSEFHQILVVTAWDKNDVTEFFVKDYWCEEFGPFYTGEDTYIKVDSPNLDTYLVRAYVKEGKNGDWQLVSESWNQEQVYLPQVPDRHYLDTKVSTHLSMTSMMVSIISRRNMISSPTATTKYAIRYLYTKATGGVS